MQTMARRRPGHDGRRVVLATLAAICLLAAWLSQAASSALASTTPPGSTQALARAGVPGASSSQGLASPYGEVSRFGGYDATGQIPGKFVLPVGFAVDPADPSTGDHNAVYVLDRTVKRLGKGELQYRLQKLSSTGAVLGSVTLPLETFSPEAAEEETFTGAYPLISLAVDSARHRIYALVETMVDSGAGRYVPVAQRLIAFSTIPTAGKLVAAPGFPIDQLTGAGLVAGQSTLQAGEPSTDLYSPEGLTIASNHDVVIEAQQGVKEGPIGGPTILQRVGTEGPSLGKLDGSWVAPTSIAPKNEQADGVFTASNGSFGIDLFQEWGGISRLAEVKPGFEKSEASLLAPDQSGGRDLDQAPTIDNPTTINNNSNEGPQYGAAAFTPADAASPVTQLSNGLYAARYGHPGEEVTDGQSLVTPWNGVPYFWIQGGAASAFVGNLGVRLFTSNGAIVTTIGGQPEGQTCNLDFAQLGLAAGSNGSVFVLTQPNLENGGSDDQVIELSPGGKGSCPQPSGSLTLNGQSGSSFSFPVGTNVTFADTVERKGEAPYRFDWVLFNSSSIEDLKTQIEGPEYKWPAPSTSHTFTKSGTYYVTATVCGDYGLTYITTDTIKIH
jgi:hypothetical protein